MGNCLNMADKQRIQALLELGWSYRRIQRETGVYRDTVARYDPKRTPKPAKVAAGSMAKPAGVCRCQGKMSVELLSDFVSVPEIFQAHTDLPAIDAWRCATGLSAVRYLSTVSRLILSSLAMARPDRPRSFAACTASQRLS